MSTYVLIRVNVLSATDNITLILQNEYSHDVCKNCVEHSATGIETLTKGYYVHFVSL